LFHGGKRKKTKVGPVFDDKKNESLQEEEEPDPKEKSQAEKEVRTQIERSTQEEPERGSPRERNQLSGLFYTSTTVQERSRTGRTKRKEER